MLGHLSLAPRSEERTMSEKFKIGEIVVVVSEDPDLAQFCGIVGKVVQIGVPTMGGEGLIFDAPDYGLLKGNYEMFERLQ